jgi:hypothetical protein
MQKFFVLVNTHRTVNWNSTQNTFHSFAFSGRNYPISFLGTLWGSTRYIKPESKIALGSFWDVSGFLLCCFYSLTRAFDQLFEDLGDCVTHGFGKHCWETPGNTSKEVKNEWGEGWSQAKIYSWVDYHCVQLRRLYQVSLLNPRGNWRIDQPPAMKNCLGVWTPWHFLPTLRNRGHLCGQGKPSCRESRVLAGRNHRCVTNVKWVGIHNVCNVLLLKGRKGSL